MRRAEPIIVVTPAARLLPAPVRTGVSAMRQLALPMQTDPGADLGLKDAWIKSGLRIPYDAAIHVPALVICLRHLAATGSQRKRNRRGIAARVLGKRERCRLKFEIVD